tara:strand:- start:67 stop:381 length:315 start_codon:yes stop_codon:yes gene_type:complete
MKEFKLPKKWFIHVTEESCASVDSFLRQNKDLYKGYADTWYIQVGYYYYFPQEAPHSWGSEECNLHPEFTEITFSQFKQYVLKEKIEIDNGNSLLPIFEKLNIR